MSKQLSFDDARPNKAARLAEIKQNRTPIRLLLDSVYDQRNIGGLFRTADASRLAEIVLYNCPFDSKNRKFKKTARSTFQYVPHRILADENDLHIYAQEHQIVCLEYTSKSTILSETSLSLPLTLVLGNEQRGVSQTLLDLSTQSVHLPMMGMQSSLNVCTAGSIAIYELLRRIS